MSAGKAFLDTNVLVYAQDTSSPAKQQQSRRLIAHLAAAGTGVISTQVPQETHSSSGSTTFSSEKRTSKGATKTAPSTR